MKKIISIILAAAIAGAGLSACGNASAVKSSEASSDNAAEEKQIKIVTTMDFPIMPPLQAALRKRRPALKRLHTWRGRWMNWV